MRFAIVLALMLIAMGGTRYGASSARIAEADTTAIGNIIVGLIMLIPVAGVFVLFRMAFTWQRQFHRRMSDQGAWRAGDRS